MSSCPENVGTRSSLPQSESEFSPRSIQSSFPLLQGPAVQGPSHRQHFLDPTGSNTIAISDRIENKNVGNRPLKKYHFSTFARASAPPENVGTRSSAPQNEPRVSSIYPELFPASPGPSRRKSPSASSYSQVILKRGRPLSSIFGAKGHAIRTY